MCKKIIPKKKIFNSSKLKFPRAQTPTQTTPPPEFNLQGIGHVLLFYFVITYTITIEFSFCVLSYSSPPDFLLQFLCDAMRFSCSAMRFVCNALSN